MPDTDERNLKAALKRGWRKNRKQEKMFNKLDDNGDGFISAEEFAEMKDHRRGKWFKFFAKDQKDDGQTND